MDNSARSNDICILLGVGGTGAKVVEAALILMAAGLGPKQVHVGLVDQDLANGNVLRTDTLINNIVRFRNRWSDGHANKLDWSANSAMQVGAVNILPLFEKPESTSVWCPEQRKGTLHEIIGQNPPSEDHKELFDLLFMANDQEQKLPLDVGYQGRAHIGSAAMVASLVEPNNPLTRRLRELISDANRRRVNIFIVGSAFGGTGAAGFPTIARALHRMKDDEELSNRENIFIGGQLMLPYFQFDNNDEDPTAVQSNKLMPKAQLALEYYHNLFEHERTFDRFYVTGWNELFDLDYHEKGNRAQSNPALIPELVAATAMLDFFGRDNRAEREDAESGDEVPVMTSARESQVIKWADLPPDAEVRLKLGQMLRFAALWRFEGRALLKEKTLFGLNKNWAQKLAAGVNIDDSEDDLNSLDLVLDGLLHWAATIEATGETSWIKGPWTLEGLRDPRHTKTPTEPVALAQHYDSPTFRAAFDRLIRVDSGSEENSRSGAAVMENLVRAEPSMGTHKGIGRAIAALYDAVSLG